MPYIGNPPAERFTSFAYQDLTGGSGTSFTLDNAVGNTQEIEVFVNNVRQEPGVAYTVSGTALTMTGSIATTDDFYVVFQGKAIQTATHPSDRALTATDGTFTGDLTISDKIIHSGDTDTTIRFPAADNISFETGGGEKMAIDNTGVIINDDSADLDFRVEGNGSTHLIFADGGNDKVGFGASVPTQRVSVEGTANDQSSELKVTATAVASGYIGPNASGLNIGTDTAGLVFKTGVTGGGSVGNTGTVRMAILSDGAVGIGQTSPDSLLKVKAVSGLTGNAKLSYFYDDQNRLGNYRQNAHASFDSSMSLHYTERAANSAYNFLIMSSGGASDTEFSFRGDGNGFCDGSFSGGGADYAEYFEWDDGNSSDEDRRGYSVVLVGNKIRKATSSDAASDIIGVVSATPAMVGDAAWDRWEGKYLTDDYGAYLKEAYTATQWTETDADGVETPRYYETDKIPADVTVPSDAVVTSTETDGSLLMRRRLNPDYDDTQTYVPREERQEWDTVGLMGKLRLRAGQPTGDRWIKMRDIATDDDGNVTVEEWLVR